MIDFLSQIKNILFNMLKLLKVPGLFIYFCSEFEAFLDFFFKISQIPVFSRFLA